MYRSSIQLIILMLFGWSCSNFNYSSRHLSGIEDVGIIGPGGEVVLFYKEGEKIVIKQCADKILKSRNDCKPKAGTREQRVPVSEFKNSLKTALRLPGNYDNSNKKKIELYNTHLNGQKEDVQSLKNKKKQLKVKIVEVKNFIDTFGNENTDKAEYDVSKYDFSLAEYDSLKYDLSQVEEKIDKHVQLNPIIKKINEKIDHLVDNIVSSNTLYKYTFSKQKTGFIFNILRSYTRSAILSASFEEIESGIFTMGLGGPRDQISRNVIISKSFEIMTKEVTQMQWFLVMGNNPSQFSTPEYCDNYININGEGICPSNPVETVSWYDVHKYIKKLNAYLGLVCKGIPKDPAGCYRLPTEAEWEYAARAGTRTTYSFGNDSSILKDYAWYDANSEKKTHPVGLKKPNDEGLYDMHGNVQEWTYDVLDKSIRRGADKTLKDPIGRPDDCCATMRGGGWNSGWLSKDDLGSANNSYLKKSHKVDFLGFRLVRTLH